ncbi:hypothetical protein [Rhizobium bangladeshense]|uniref:hypothetical protein n=1 Tax=Rhizobium bangladeshense TaxID=1138189 RepID=UPI001C8350F9|nr:hypothetical protein [Rhizobium bangladeshense]MBX4895548.1 hypothetical protein [Rhizobium bangladeshense]MBY3616241.1 hypothetical protein [Rhizobium bangladeshense]
MTNLLCICHEMHPHPSISHPFLAKRDHKGDLPWPRSTWRCWRKQNAQILDELRALRRELAELKEQLDRTLDFERRNDPRRPSSLTQR